MIEEETFTVRKNNREEIRVCIQEYRGTEIASLRVWFTAADGTMRPGKDGVNFRLALLPAISDAVTAALVTARARGLIEG